MEYNPYLLNQPEAPPSRPEFTGHGIRHEFGPEVVAEIPLDAEPLSHVKNDKGEDVPLHALVVLPGHGPSEQAGSDVELAVSVSKDGLDMYAPGPGQTVNHRHVPTHIGTKSSLLQQQRFDQWSNRFAQGTSPYSLGINFLAPSKENPAGSVVLHTVPNHDISPLEAQLTPVIRTGVESVMHELPGSNVNQLLREKNRPPLRRKKLKAWGKNILAAAGIYSAVMSGGLADHAVEGIQDAGPATIKMLENPTELDNGLSKSEKRKRNENATEHKKYKESVSRVADVMEDWDKGNFSAIAEKANAFRREHADQLMAETKVTEIRQRLEKAQTIQEAQTVLNDFLSFYGKDLQFLEKDFKTANIEMGAFDASKVSAADLQAFGESLIDSISHLPKPLLEKARFKHVTIGANSNSHFYDPINRSVNYGIDGMTGVKGAPLNVSGSFLEPTANSHVINHEIGHSLSNGAHYGEEIPFGEALAKGAGYVLSRVVSFPSEQSVYASIEGTEEKTAENIATALDVKGRFAVADPDEWRFFNSGANQQTLGVYARFEEDMPGLTAYMVNLKVENSLF